MNFKLIELNSFNDKSSTLVAIEKGINCPFEIKRSFYIFNVPQGISRGNHANINSEFLFIALQGQCKIKIDDSQSKQEFILNNPKQALYINKMIWKEMFEFSSDCILLVFTNTYYDKKEYIYDYEEFLRSVSDT
ncbi:WxcM-like domain-containing protein [Campylobacter jejuni]|uniref:sugar 3,4-ketoisomerase n=1 Tax=Campylobacter jejuni TaxID=197 RepID=UPI000F7FF6D2|nr:FdtA/QdtA family cupin domain-containing protein [Campylobacter jejuni]MCH3877096.1 FdtA/QdtA family cupin domain-containing protein [Campylobacter jejuni]RTJ08673.1 WxcM-like domain-containing protein [Campylobacter jejuni]HED0491772.1 WxcM-like domain-containing protein [Campylobacter jejuni]HED0523054.1 WxcM-like domain-containing protein [Campylobacter jejuni]HED0573935.1 WxcM-like domain-containing protein [Campylobacter jejuni]